MKKLYFILSIAILMSGFQAMGQQRCATVPYQKNLNPNNSEIEIQFENWISTQQVAPKIKSFGTEGTTAATYVIPVVFHIIHNGEPIGTGTNLSEAQVLSQVDVLNKDFQRLNNDAGQTPPEFMSVASSLDIEFVLAKQDPEGLATTGIRRVQGTQSEWTLAENSIFKALSYWPSENYLNIWVINFNDPSNFIGYAQFPESPLSGLEGSSSDPLTDGIVLHFDVVGSVDDQDIPGGIIFQLDPQFDKGRTATHEVGHFFGLRHIWGDVSSCNGSDFVDDTPPQATETTGCPSHPQVSCSTNKMFQNYLDFTNDACMNIFTAGQVARMEIILQNSPRRESLTTSPGSQDPVPVPNDLGLREILSPGTTTCGGTVIPQVEVRNFGTNTITSAQIEFKVNGISQEIKNFGLSLNVLDITTLSFNPINLTSPSNTTVSFEIIQTNGTTDGKTSDNLLSHTATVSVTTTVPFFEFFDEFPLEWAIQNPDGRETWVNVAANNGSPGNRSMFINFFDYEEKGVLDRLLSPVINLDGAEAALLQFDRAYAKFPGSSFNDGLRVIVVTDCNSDLSSGIEIFNKSGAELATADDTFNPFSPNEASQWETESISLSQFISSGNIQVVFIGQNSNGNNLYLDNVFILTGDITDLALKELLSPSPVVNKTNLNPEIRIKNEGSVPITSLKIETAVNGQSLPVKSLTSLNLLTGEELIVPLDPIVLNQGANQLQITLTEPNGNADEAPSNNTITRTVIVNDFSEAIPARQNFNISFQDSWTIVSQGSQLNWEITTTNKGSSLVYRAFTNTAKGDEAWLVSPVLDFSKSIKASLFFDVSYAVSFKGTERLRILSSIDGGNTFIDTEFDQTGNQFSSGSSTEAWIPADDQDWQHEFINLNDLAGEQNARLAFVVTNDNGNNLYLDDIELFNDDNPAPPQASAQYNVYMTSSTEVKITFNLPEKETSRIQIYNTMGQVVLDNLLPDNLNQTYTFDMVNQRAGIYIVRIQAANKIEATKVFISR